MSDPRKPPDPPDEVPADEPYLWDRSGPTDPEVARLEALLAPLAHRASLRAAPTRRRWAGATRTRAFAATAVGLAAAAAWIVVPRLHLPTSSKLAVSKGFHPPPIVATRSCDTRTPGSYAFRTEGGPVKCGSTQVESSAWLAVDEILETGNARATLDVATLGTVAMDPGTKLRVLPVADDVQTISLLQGTVRARINAAPRRFVVKTAAADAVDLGCEYTLTVDDGGRGLLSVSYGSVSLEREGRAPTLVPQGASCAIGAQGPGTPLADDANRELRSAAADLDAGDAAAFDRLVFASTASDTITLWHVMRRIAPDERGKAYDRLATFVPAPKGAARDAIVRGDRAAIVAYRDVLMPRWFAGGKK